MVHVAYTQKKTRIVVQRYSEEVSHLVKPGKTGVVEFR
jgi:hypothetical protein